MGAKLFGGTETVLPEPAQQHADINLWLRDLPKPAQCSTRSCAVMVRGNLQSVNAGPRFSQSLHGVTRLPWRPAAYRP